MLGNIEGQEFMLYVEVLGLQRRVSTNAHKSVTTAQTGSMARQYFAPSSVSTGKGCRAG